MSKKILALTLLVAGVALANMPLDPAWQFQAPADGGVSWLKAPNDATGWYYCYDDDDGQPFSYPVLPPLPGTYNDVSGSGMYGLSPNKLEPYANQPYGYSLPDSFWYFGYWYEPGDHLHISPDGWVSFDESSEDGFPNPPSTVPPIPVTDDPNELIAVLWQDNNPLDTPDPTDDNRVWYVYQPTGSTVGIEWNNIVSVGTGNTYEYSVTLDLGGQDKLWDYGPCGIVYSTHFIEMQYNANSGGWTADNGVTGIENQAGTHGIWYEGTLANGRTIRYGYRKLFTHDVAALQYLSPGEMVLRWTPIEPWVIVANVGLEAETFNAILEIYEGDEQVYQNVLGSYHLLPEEWDTLNAPCWTPGEFGTEYEKRLIVSLDGDQCETNDVNTQLSVVECNDTFAYDWDFATYGSGNGWGITSGAVFGTFYPVDNGVLVTGGRAYTEQAGTDYAPTRIQVWSAGADGCGVVENGQNAAGYGDSPAATQVGWNYAQFGGFGVFATGGEPGNIWAAVTSPADDNYSGYWFDYGLLNAPTDHSCYYNEAGAYGYPQPGWTGGGRSGTWSWDSGSGSYDFMWGESGGGVFYSTGYGTYPIELFVHLGFGAYPLSPMPAHPCYHDEAHDLTAYRFDNPDIEWVEDGVPITAEIGIANLGRQAEPDEGFFTVKFHAVEESSGDTVHSEDINVDHIGWLGADDGYDTLLIAAPDWTPDGACEDWTSDDVGVHYELIGLVLLGEVGPDLSDHCPYNDTTRLFVTALLSDDVGCTDFVSEHEWGDSYPTGTVFNIVATVENFGFNEEHDIPVDMEIIDRDAEPDSVVWHNIQEITFLDWRGNDLENPYTVEVEYPAWTTPSENHFTLECRTEMVGDDCPENNESVHAINSGVEEGLVKAVFSLDAITPNPFVGSTTVSYSVANTTNVSLKVYDISGKLVTTLVDGTRNAGSHSIKWNGTDNAGRTVAQGIYLVRMDAESFSATKKVVLY